MNPKGIIPEARGESLRPRDAQALRQTRPLLALTELRERQGDVPGALAALARAHAQKPRAREVAPRYGRLLSQSGRLDEAATVLAAWTREHDDDAQSIAELGFVRFRQQRVDEAASLLKRALRKDARLSVAHYYLGAVLFRQGDTAGAERAYQEADRLAPPRTRAPSPPAASFTPIRATRPPWTR